MPRPAASARTHPDPGRMRALAHATQRLEPPFVVLDEQAYAANADDLVARAQGTPIRLASKSIRVRSLLEETLRRPGYAGVLGYSLAEGLWLARQGVDDVLVAYPSVDRAALAELAGDPVARRRVTIMVDDVRQLDLVEDAIGPDVPAGAVRVALDVDASLRLGRLHLGARRSPVHSPEQAGALARAVAARPWARLVAVMLYDAQVAGQPDTVLLRRLKAASLRELDRRRSRVVAAVQEVAGEPLVVNAGGTGSVHLVGADPCVTEVAAGSGLFAPVLFDGYDDFTPTPAMYFVTSVVRVPAPGLVTVFAGGYAASGPHGRSRLPSPVWPAGLHLLAREGAGEVQTPLAGPGAIGLRPGDRVWFRHAKAGELCERFAMIYGVDAEGQLHERPTYRGEGRCFG